MICRYCGEINADNSTYCIECGSLLVMPERKIILHQTEVNAPTIECPHCHQANPVSNMFCTNCRKNMKYEAVDKRPLGIRMAGHILGWLFKAVFAIIYFIVIFLLVQAITSIGVAMGLPFDNSIATPIIFGLVAVGVTIIIVLLFSRDRSRKK